MKKKIYLPGLIVLFLVGCSSSQMATVESVQSVLREVASESMHSVVQVQTRALDRLRSPGDWDFYFEDSDIPFDFFEREGLGSGVIVAKDDAAYYILTNNHVIGDSEDISVILHDDTALEARVVGRDTNIDIALLAIETEKDLRVIKLGDSSMVQVGDFVMAVGNPYGYTSSVTFGNISAVDRRTFHDRRNDYIQTDAAINQGNSGGALVNIYGELVGINTWISTPTGGNIGLGFAIPVNNVKKSINDFIEYGEPRYGWLGVSLTELSVQNAVAMGIEDISGVFINHVYIDSPAFLGGIRPGDYITAIDNKKITSLAFFLQFVAGLEQGVSHEFELIRFQEQKTVSVDIGLRPAQTAISAEINKLFPGFTIMSIDESTLDYVDADVDSGVLVLNVENRTRAFLAGLMPGDVIKSVNGQEINNALDFFREIHDKYNREYSLDIIRKSDELQITVVKD